MNHLVIRAVSGDESAEKQLFQYLSARFRLIAKHRLRGEQEAEDIAQEACLTVFQKYKQETFTTGFENWAYGILRMKIGNYFQKKKIRNDAFSAEVDPEQAADLEISMPDHDLKKQLLDCLKKMTRVHLRYARVLNLIHLGYKAQEICSQIHTNVDNIYVILNRGRLALKNCLATGKV